MVPFALCPPPLYNPDARLSSMIETTTTIDAAEALDRLAAGERLSLEEWKAVEDHTPTPVLGRLADELRKKLHPDDAVTYVVDRNVNYLNVCGSAGTFRGL